MLDIVDDYALHQQNTQIGQIFGHGHQVTDGVYIATLEVRMSKRKGTRRQSRFMGNLHSTGMLKQTTEIPKFVSIKLSA
ncbi:MAG: hypothetical protein KME21_05310 [Desmonostoc vinosum HA7617-LM4]|jgi:hypothetical protein|nr:hypothetical protein [Desmonostoc vinosum HA7617-LM4]